MSAAGGVPPARPRLELGEWQTGTLAGASLSPADRRVVETLHAHNRLRVDELRSGVRVAARSSVGVVGFEHFDVRVSPKLAGGALAVAGMLALTRGLDALGRIAGSQPLLLSTAADLLELLALLLAEACEPIVRGGLRAAYVEHDDALPAIRGRLLADRQLLERHGRVDRVLCRFDEPEHDIPDNQLLGLALQLSARCVRRETLRRRLRALAAVFEEVCAPERLDIAAVRRGLDYDRQNAHYRPAHGWALRILDGLGVDDALAASAPVRSFAFLLDMNRLFEEFVHQLVAWCCPPPRYRVDAQRTDTSVLWNASDARSYARVRPDVVVAERAGGRVVAVDAKYKRYDDVAVANADLYQSLLYASAYATGARPPVSLLAYPSEEQTLVTTRVQLRATFAVRAEVCVVGVPVAGAIAEMREGRGRITTGLRAVLDAALA